MSWVKRASWYILATEEYNSSNSMIATVVLKTKIDTSRLYLSYLEMVRENPILQTKIVKIQGNDAFEWGRFSPEELESLLSFEKEQLSKQFTQEELLSRYEPTNKRLPFHFSVVDEYTLLFFMNHVMAHGRGLTFWIQKWLQYYTGEKDESLQKSIGRDSWKDKIPRILKRGRAFFWMPVFLFGFLKRISEGTASETVDLSYGKKPEKNSSYVKKSYKFHIDETELILRQCRLQKMTLSEYLCYQLTRGLFWHDSRKKRVLVSVPMDVYSLHPYSMETMCGNFIGGLPLQFFQNENLKIQVKAAFKWFKRGVPYSLLVFFSVFSNSYEKSKRSSLKRCQKAIPDRAGLGNYSIYFSNLGVISYPAMEKWVESIHFSFKSQFILITASTLSKELMLEVCISKKLYNQEEVFQLFDRILSLEFLLNSD